MQKLDKEVVQQVVVVLVIHIVKGHVKVIVRIHLEVQRIVVMAIVVVVVH